MVDDQGEQARGEQAGGEPPPASGWKAPRRAHTHSDPDVDALKNLLHQILSLAPQDLRARLIDTAHALLAALRALIDWLRARVEACSRTGASTDAEVHDIPIV